MSASLLQMKWPALRMKQLSQIKSWKIHLMLMRLASSANVFPIRPVISKGTSALEGRKAK